jgi:hypothetical protein
MIPNDTHTAPILGIYHAAHAQAHYRLAVPLKTAYGEGCAVTAWDSVRPEQLDAADVVVLSKLRGHLKRAGDDGATSAHAFVQGMQHLGGKRRRVLIDQDDDLNPPPAVSAWTAEDRIAFQAMIRAADGLITTNATLAGRLSRLGTPTRVLPNYIRPDWWPEAQAASDDAVWLLVTGSQSHDPDWREVERPLRALKGKYPALRLRVAGHLPKYLRDLADEHRPWTDCASYPSMIAGCHIALCPLPRTDFNVCKSPIKLYETALSGCAVLGSETQYGPVLRAAGLPRAVCSPYGWAGAIERYLLDPSLRSAEAAQLRAYVLSSLDARLHVGALRAAYAATPQEYTNVGPRMGLAHAG